MVDAGADGLLVGTAIMDGDPRENTQQLVDATHADSGGRVTESVDRTTEMGERGATQSKAREPETETHNSETQS